MVLNERETNKMKEEERTNVEPPKDREGVKPRWTWG
jgi:hypothetical protein